MVETQPCDWMIRTIQTNCKFAFSVLFALIWGHRLTSIFRDELVIETPTLFAAEEYSDNEQQSRQGANQNNNSNKKTTRFAIAGEEEEDDDDDFEDFAEWDEDPIINMKGDKIH